MLNFWEILKRNGILCTPTDFPNTNEAELEKFKDEISDLISSNIDVILEKITLVGEFLVFIRLRLQVSGVT